MGKLTDYTAVTALDDSDILIVDGTSGTRKITVANAAQVFLNTLPAYMHRNIYRGKNLGTEVTSAQLAAIQAGTFDDIWVGDYWVIGGVTWRIVDLDYWYQTGDTSFTNHHAVIMPDSPLYYGQMNESNTTEGGYVGSLMYTSGLDAALVTVSSAFGSMLLSHREYLVNAVLDGRPTAAAWYDSYIELPNEIMMYGSYIRGVGSSGTEIATRTTIDKTQLALFKLVPKFINNNRTNCWLRDVASSTSFAYVGLNGYAYISGASNSVGVRPVFPIG